MKNLKNSLPFKSFHEHIVILGYLLLFYRFFQNHFPITTILVCMILWFLYTKNSSWILLGIILFLLNISIPIPHTNSIEGKIIHIKDSYIIVHSGFSNFIIYTDEPLIYDSSITVEGNIETPKDQKGFYRFSYQNWCASENIKGVIHDGTITVVKERHTIRSFIQRHIYHCDFEIQSFLRHTLLHQKSNLFESDILQDGGYYVIGFLALLELLLKQFFYPKKVKNICFICTVLFGGLYHFPVLLLYRVIRYFLSYSKLSYTKQFAYLLIILCVIRSGVVYHSGFMMIVLFHMFSSREHNTLNRFLLCSIYQSITYSIVHPIQILFFSYFRYLKGVLYLIGMIGLFFPMHFIVRIGLWVDSLFQFTDYFIFYGNCMGFGLLFYLLFIIVSKQNRRVWASIFFYVFMLFGLFHPFGEITYLNVGQGDSILLRAPLNQYNVLIDTGLPTQRNTLHQYFHAKGIHKIHLLLITHSDSDHNGNQQEIINTYHVEQVLTNHFEKYSNRFFTFYDLNTENNVDENSNSLTILTKWNGLTYLFPGDIPSMVEEEIIDSYQKLSIDILKLAHHGSKTSSSDKFLDTVRPKVAIISCGAYSIYHHPSEEVIQRLLKRHIPYLITREEGDISIFGIFRKNLLLTSSRKIAIMGI